MKKKSKKETSIEETRWMLRHILHGLVDDIHKGHMSDYQNVEIWHLKIEQCFNPK